MYVNCTFQSKCFYCWIAKLIFQPPAKSQRQELDERSLRISQPTQKLKRRPNFNLQLTAAISRSQYGTAVRHIAMTRSGRRATEKYLKVCLIVKLRGSFTLYATWFSLYFKENTRIRNYFLNEFTVTTVPLISSMKSVSWSMDQKL